MSTTEHAVTVETTPHTGLKGRIAELAYPFLVAVVAAILMAGLWGPSSASTIPSTVVKSSFTPTPPARSGAFDPRESSPSTTGAATSASAIAG